MGRFETLLGCRHGSHRCSGARAVHAQQKAMPVIGYMSGGSASFYWGMILPAFRDGLREASYVEGENVTIDYRWAEGDYDRLPAFAAEFVQRHVNLIAATGGPAAKSEDLNLISSPTVAGAYSGHWRQRLALSAPFVDREDWRRASSAETQ